VRNTCAAQTQADDNRRDQGGLSTRPHMTSFHEQQTSADLKTALNGGKSL
jgi:hypothetical protein